jgi:hypothetical protein
MLGGVEIWRERKCAHVCHGVAEMAFSLVFRKKWISLMFLGFEALRETSLLCSLGFQVFRYKIQISFFFSLNFHCCCCWSLALCLLWWW